MENALRANPQDAREEFEGQIRELEGAPSR